MANVCKLLRIFKTCTTPYHPQSLLPLCIAYNSSVHPATGYTPFNLMFGHNENMPIDLMHGSYPTEVNQPQNANKFVAKLQIDCKISTLQFETLWDITCTDKRYCLTNQFMGNPSRKITWGVYTLKLSHMEWFRSSTIIGLGLSD